jgi:hypothetical protein
MVVKKKATKVWMEVKTVINLSVRIKKIGMMHKIIVKMKVVI